MGHSEVWGAAGDRLLLVGLTGGIACGKTEVALELSRLGAMVIDADSVARDVTAPGGEAYSAIVEYFGKEVLDRSNEIDRGVLAGMVFDDQSKRLALNAITHPAIFSEIIHRVGEYASDLDTTDVPAAVVDAALIVDVGASSMFDLLLVVCAEEDERIKRMIADRGMNESECRSRISSQIPDCSRLEMADLVIENNGTLNELRRAVGDTWNEIERRARELYG